MNEPDNHTAWVDRLGDTWVRADDMPGRNGNWWPLTDGPGWDEHARVGVGVSWDWEGARDYGPFTPAGAERTAAALARVRRVWSR